MEFYRQIRERFVPLSMLTCSKIDQLNFRLTQARSQRNAFAIPMRGANCREKGEKKRWYARISWCKTKQNKKSASANTIELNLIMMPEKDFNMEKMKKKFFFFHEDE